LIKGPVVALVAGLAIATLCIVDRSTALVKALRPWWGIPLAALVVAPWLIALQLGGEGSFVADAVRQDVLPKLLGGQEFHGAPPGTHMIVALATLWPWSLLIPVVLIAGWPHRQDAAIRFCLAWLVPGWLAFEAIPTKLPNYILPMVPAAALLIGGVVANFPGFTPLLRRRGDLAWRAVWALMSVGLAFIAVWVAARYSDGGIAAKPWALILVVSMLLAAFLAVALHRRTSIGLVLTAATVFGLGIGVTLVTRYAPSLDRVWVSERLANAAARHPSPEPLLLAGYHEPSAVFRLGTHIELVHPRTAAAALIAHPGRVAVVDATMMSELQIPVEEAGFRVVPLEAIEGQNYAAGKFVHLTLLTIAKP
jgi:4-amino-4-deoxy-L-arabinose transferase-like glycosyltransferase